MLNPPDINWKGWGGVGDEGRAREDITHNQLQNVAIVRFQCAPALRILVC